MPTYQYRCEKCGNWVERTETMSEHDTAKPQAQNVGVKRCQVSLDASTS